LFVKLSEFNKYTSKISKEKDWKKLSTYDFSEIETLQYKASQYLATTTELSRVELSYAFTLGMTMQREAKEEGIRIGAENKKKKELAIK
jgi:hypothetical protein